MKIYYFLLTACFCMLMFSARAVESEPNNTRAQANVLALNGNNSGTVAVGGDEDWYRVTTNSDGKLEIGLSPTTGKYTWVFLYDNNGTTLLGSSYSTSAFTVSQDGLSPGTYYVMIRTYYSTETSPYNITNTLTSATPANDLEPNNSRAQANNLPVNNSKTGHVGFYYNNLRDSSDWYKITTTQDGVIKLNLTSHNGKYTYIYLYDNDGTTLLNSAYSTTSFNLSTEGLAAGTYYVRVKLYYPSDFTTYTLIDSLLPYNQANDVEPNNNRASALTLAQNGTTTGHVGFYYNNERDSSDWYKVNTNTDGRLELTLTPGISQYVWAYLYDNNGTTLLASSYSTSQFTISKDGLAPGTYYVRVNCYYNYNFAPYTISSNLSTYNYAVDAEPNKYFASAKTLPANAEATGHVGFYYNLGRDTSDAWKINYTGNDGIMSLQLNFENAISGGNKYTYVKVYKDTAAAPIYNNYFLNNATINFTNLAQGYYYVRVHCYYNYDFQSYALGTSFNQDNIANISITQSISGGCTSGQLEMQGYGSNPPYTVRLYRFGTLYNTYVTNETGGYTASNLPPGIYYATAYGDGATGNAYGTSNTRSLNPPAPGSTSESNITSNAATVNYTKVDCANGYAVQWRKQGTTAWSQKIVLGNKDFYRITGLTPGTTYQWRVLTGVGLDTISTYVISGFTPIDVFTTASSLIADEGAQGQSSVFISPNPVANQFRMQINLDNKEKVSAILRDAQGNVFWNISNVQVETLNNMQVNVSHLKSGIYYLQIGNDTNLVTNKVIINR